MLLCMEYHGKSHKVLNLGLDPEIKLAKSLK